jgi:hypothetical protein
MATVASQYEAFAGLAEQYCAAIEDPTVQGAKGLRKIHDLLLPVHAAAMNLPHVENDAHLERSIPHDEAWAVFQGLQQRLAVDRYWDSFNPLGEPDNQSIQSSLADDLCDIWRALKEGLLELNREDGQPREDIWWEWRFGFQTHWGHHSAGALRVLYFALRDRA